MSGTNEETAELENPVEAPEFTPGGDTLPVDTCMLCGAPSGGIHGALMDHPDADGLVHLSCLFAKESLEQKKGFEARIREEESKRKEAEKAAAEKEIAQPTTPCEKARVKWEEATTKLEVLEEQEDELLETLQEAKKGYDKCREVEAEKARRLADRLDRRSGQPIIEYRSRSNLKLHIPTIGGTTLLLCFLVAWGFGLFEPRQESVEPEIRVETKIIQGPFPKVEFAFDASKTECYDEIEKFLSSRRGQLYHDQVPILKRALEQDRVKLIFRVREDGELELIRTEKP